MICHLVKANPEMLPEHGTGWHRHKCDFQIVIMTKGRARFMYADKPTLVQAGDKVPPVTPGSSARCRRQRN